jgi:hypothetical protein
MIHDNVLNVYNESSVNRHVELRTHLAYRQIHSYKLNPHSSGCVGPIGFSG